MNRLPLPELLGTKKRPILVEFDPPRQTDPDTFLSGARELAEAGADMITIADCPIGQVSIDSSLLAAKLKPMVVALCSKLDVCGVITPEMPPTRNAEFKPITW